MNHNVAVIIDRSLPVPAFKVGGPGDPDRLDDELVEGLEDEFWASSGGCPCGNYHGQRDGAMVHCAFQEPQS